MGTCDFISIPKHKKEQKQLRPWRTFYFEKIKNNNNTKDVFLKAILFEIPEDTDFLVHVRKLWKKIEQ